MRTDKQDRAGMYAGIRGFWFFVFWGAFFWLHGYFVFQYFDGFGGLIDVNGDGRFTVSDLPTVVFGAATEIGASYERVLARHQIGQFFELGENPDGWGWKLSLTLFAGYFLPIGLNISVIDWLYKLEDRKR